MKLLEQLPSAKRRLLTSFLCTSLFLGLNRSFHWSYITLVSEVKLLSRVGLFMTHGLQPPNLLLPLHFPGKNSGVDCHLLLHTSHWKFLFSHPFPLLFHPQGQKTSFIYNPQLQDLVWHFNLICAEYFWLAYLNSPPFFT